MRVSVFRMPRAVVRCFVTGVRGSIIASAEDRRLVGGLGLSSTRKFSNWEAPKRYFQHLFMRYVSEKSTSNKCEKAGVFYTRLVAGCAMTGTLCKLEWTLQIVHIHANLNRAICFALLTICTHRKHGEPTNFSSMKMANNCKSLQSKWLNLQKTTPSKDLICLAQQVQRE